MRKIIIVLIVVMLLSYESAVIIDQLDGSSVDIEKFDSLTDCLKTKGLFI